MNFPCQFIAEKARRKFFAQIMIKYIIAKLTEWTFYSNIYGTVVRLADKFPLFQANPAEVRLEV